MRTTLTLDPDVAKMIETEVHRSRRSVKAVTNEAIRRGLSGGAGAAQPAFKVEPLPIRLRPGIDPGRFNQLVDELEVAEHVSKKGRAG